MNFLDQLTGDYGCSVDGTVGTNPINSLANQIFLSNLGTAGFEDQFYPEEDVQFSINVDNYRHEDSSNSVLVSPNESGLNLAWQQQFGDAAQENVEGMIFSNGNMGATMPFVNMSMMSMPMIPMMQMAHNTKTNNDYYLQSTTQLTENAFDDKIISDHAQSERANIIDSPSSSQELDRIIMDAMMSGNLDPQTSRDLLSFFNASSEMSEDIYDSKLELGLQGETGLHRLMTENVNKEGYDAAWDRTVKTLESLPTGQHDYVFSNHNIYDDQNLSAQELFETGMRYFRDGHINQALPAFEKLVQIEVGHDEGWRMLGTCHAESDNDKNAIYCLQRAIDCDPYNLEALLQLGTSYVNEVDPFRAVEVLKTWLAHNPKFQGLQFKPDEYSDGTVMDEVMQLMLAASQFAPDDADVQILLGVIYNASYDYDSAIMHLRQAVQLRPNDYSVHNKLGATLANSSRNEDAIESYAIALELRPKFARGWLNLGIAYANMEQFTDAVKAYMQAIQLSPNASHIWDYMRMAFTSLDRWDLVEAAAKRDTEMILRELKIELLVE